MKSGRLAFAASLFFRACRHAAKFRFLAIVPLATLPPCQENRISLIYANLRKIQPEFFEIHALRFVSALGGLAAHVLRAFRWRPRLRELRKI